MSFAFDMTDLYAMEKRIAEAPDQIRFAAARALNDAAERTMVRLANETWPAHVTVRNPTFLKAALSTTGERATKATLAVTVYDRLGRGHLAQHDKGGVVRPKGGQLAVPTKRVQKGARGVVKNQKPRALKRKVVKNGLIFQAVGRGKNSRLMLMYSLRASTRLKADVPLTTDFGRFMSEEMARSFPKRFSEALTSRKS